MNPFDWKIWILFTIPGLIAIFFAIGVSLGHSLLSAVLSIAVLLFVLFLYIKRKKGEAK
jgi:hypothetical protein